MNNLSSVVINPIIFATSFMHVSNATNYVLSLRIGYVQWHFWAVGILLCLLFALLTGSLFKITRLSGSYIACVFLFLAVCALSLILVDSSPSAVQGFISYLWFFASGLALLLLVRSDSQIKACGFGVLAAVLFLSVLTIMEFLDPNFQVIVDRFFEDKYDVGDVNRSGALYEDPNDNGIALVLGMFLGQFFLPKGLRIPFYLVVGFAVLGTVSRGSMTIWGIAVTLSLMFGYSVKSRAAGFVGLVVVSTLALLLVSGEIPSFMDNVGMGNLLTVDMRQRLSENFFTQSDGSTEARIAVAREAFSQFTSNSISGIGISKSGDLLSGVGTHNQHLKIATELGILGLLMYAGFFILAIASRSMIAILFFLLYLIIGFTNHSMMTFTVYSILFQLALVFLPELGRSAPRQRRRKRRRRSSSISNRPVTEDYMK